ncbi:hypothetical protein Moror_4433 [Moniliophthora roreri MCA 2997]|uniref:ER transporter 6TM N-terminal domain-containing protein n=1 Tax=Moniliophthora roreri (strain MCA 2997) TaxID=1381753 RepID=V2XJ35_MONRO|nr:hypothetical protein Moror_4433 [Moniliophthora roreri MCA 2997]
MLNHHENGGEKGKERSDGDSSSSNPESSPVVPPLFKSKLDFKLPANLQWILANWTWSKIKVALRCAVAAWLSVVLFVIPSVEKYMGQAAFLILIASILSPPSDPFLIVIEREVLIISFVTATWGWCCLGMKLAHLARQNRDNTISLYTAIASGGRYLEPAPTVVLGTFIFVGTVILLYIRARKGPGPYLFACILSCICLITSLTTAALIPFPYYQIGQAILLPLGFHSVIAVLSAILLFPQTVSAQFTARLQDVIGPLIKSIELHRELLKMPSSSPDFADTSESLLAVVKGAEAALTPVAIAGRLLESDLIYNRFRPTDYKPLHDLVKRMAVRANGMTIYWTLIDPLREKFPVTPAPSRPGTPGVMTPVRSRAPSPRPSLERDSLHLEENKPGKIVTVTSTVTDAPTEEESAPGTPTTPSGTPRRNFLPSHSHHAHAHFHRSSHHHHHHHAHHHSLLFNALSHLSLPRMHKQEDHAVGVFESHRYLDLETTHFYDPRSEYYTERSKELLNESCNSLLVSCRESLVQMQEWLVNVRKGRWNFWVSKKNKNDARLKKLEELQALRDKHGTLLEEFKAEKRHNVTEPWRVIFDVKGDTEVETPSHRYLFHCYVFQYHLMRFSTMIMELLDEVIRLEKERCHHRLWTPVSRLFRWSGWELDDRAINHDDEDPDFVQGITPTIMNDLGMASPRDPDALPPSNSFEWVVSGLYKFITSLGGGNALYAVKAGILTTLMCLPSFIRSSSQFAYNNRFIWAIIMAQLTLARFRGDTTFGQVARITSTFLGGLVGMVIWYISAGSGNGNPFGLAAVCAVAMPFIFYLRLYYPGPPMTVLIFLVTTFLVVGYSYQDAHIILPGNPGVGWNVAWRRFVLVTVGVTAAFLFSFFPPSYTIRRYQRATLATTTSEIGAIYCAILSYASSRSAEESQEIVTSLVAIRSKLNRSAVLKANAIYEFSLRGRWPAKRYQRVLELQLSLTYSLSHLLSVIEHLEPAWTRAFLSRTRFSDPNFQGDILAVISMIATALRTGNPLPQITPCPLIDRFMLKYHGLNVVSREAEEDYGLPRTLTPETLENEQYMIFCVGVSTAFSIISRLDRLMLAVKEIVGEDYHIHGIGLTATRSGGVELGPRTSTIPYRVPGNV